MANPQKENGYTAIANDIMEALGGIRIPGEARQMLDVIFRKTYGWNKPSDRISVSQFSEATKIAKPSIVRARKVLTEMNLIVYNNVNGTPEYRINKDFETWKPFTKKLTFTKKLKKVNKKVNKRLHSSYPQKKLIQKQKEIYIPTKNSETLTEYFLSTLSEEFRAKFKDNKKWQMEFDKHLKIHTVDRLKLMIAYFRRDDFWCKNFLSPLKLSTKNRDGMKYIDYFLERMKSKPNNGTYHNPEDQLKYFEGIDDV